MAMHPIFQDALRGFAPKVDYPDPTPKMLNGDPLFDGPTGNERSVMAPPPETKAEKIAREIVTRWIGEFDPPPQIDFQQSAVLQMLIVRALSSHMSHDAENTEDSQ